MEMIRRNCQRAVSLALCITVSAGHYSRSSRPANSITNNNNDNNIFLISLSSSSSSSSSASLRSALDNARGKLNTSHHDNGPNSSGNVNRSPSSPDNGKHLPNSPDNGKHLPNSPDNGNNSPNSPDNENNLPNSPDNGNNHPPNTQGGGYNLSNSPANSHKSPHHPGNSSHQTQGLSNNSPHGPGHWNNNSSPPPPGHRSISSPPLLGPWRNSSWPLGPWNSSPPLLGPWRNSSSPPLGGHNWNNSSLHGGGVGTEQWYGEPPSWPAYLPMYVTILDVALFCTGTVGNVLVIVVVVLVPDMRTPMNWYLVNLSLADLLVLLVCQPAALIEFFARDRWLLGAALYVPHVPRLHHLAAGCPQTQQQGQRLASVFTGVLPNRPTVSGRSSAAYVLLRPPHQRKATLNRHPSSSTLQQTNQFQIDMSASLLRRPPL